MRPWIKPRPRKKQFSVRVFCGDLQRGDGFQAGLDVLLLTAVPNTGVGAGVLPSRLRPVDRSVPAAAALALAALGARRRRGADVGGGGRRGVQHLQPSDRDDGEQTVGSLLGVEGEVAEDVLVERTGSGGQTGRQAAPLILKRQNWQLQELFQHRQQHFSCENILVRNHKEMSKLFYYII